MPLPMGRTCQRRRTRRNNALRPRSAPSTETVWVARACATLRGLEVPTAASWSFSPSTNRIVPDTTMPRARHGEEFQWRDLTADSISFMRRCIICSSTYECRELHHKPSPPHHLHVITQHNLYVLKSTSTPNLSSLHWPSRVRVC